jgi:hypothetical protein
VKGYVSTLLRKPKLSRRAEAAAFISRRSMGAETPAAGPRGNGEQIRRSAG